jgi:hypothetical protein
MFGLRQGKLPVSMAIRQSWIVSVSGSRAVSCLHRIFTRNVSVLNQKSYESKRPKNHALALTLHYESTV